MKKILFMLIAMFGMMFTANAQYNVTGHRFFDNWSIGVNGGVQTNLHDWNKPQGAVTSLVLTKGITPVFALSFEGQVGWNNLTNWNKALNNYNHVHNGTVVDQLNVFVMGNVNLMNWWGGYKGTPRLFEVVAKAGVGYGHDYFNNNSEYRVTGVDNFYAKTGLDLNFNLGKSHAWTLNLSPAVVWRPVNNNGNADLYVGRAVFEATAGVTYHFKTSNKKHHFVEPDPMVIERVKEVIKEVPVEVVKEVQVPVETTQLVRNSYEVEFAFNSSELTDEAKATLNEVGENSLVVIDAYASPEGSEQYNLGLSQRRANVVKEYLEGRGVKVDSAVGHGKGYLTARKAYVRIK